MAAGKARDSARASKAAVVAHHGAAAESAGPVWTALNASDKSSNDITQFGAHTPMMRPAQPEELAPAYVFLASAQCSSNITGEILPIIGGHAGG